MNLKKFYEAVQHVKKFRNVPKQHDCVNFICDHPDIRAISFVGGDPAGRHIYNRGSANGKRVQVCTADL